MLRKTFNIILITLAGIIVVIYMLGYNYLFKALKSTYLRGETSSTIDDGKLFPYKTIEKGQITPWPISINYNKKELSTSLKEHLQKTESVSFLIIKNGELLQEHYWEGYNKTTASNSFSMAKTITTLLLGAAIEDKKIKSPNQLFSDFYKEFTNDPLGKNLTLENLASMESGLDWNEDYKSPFQPNAAAYYGYSLADVVFKRNFKNQPGEKFEYQSGSTQLLGFAVGKAVGMPLSFYASVKLWRPLGMEQNAKWQTDEVGVEKTFCCIDSNARDWAKIGQLLLNKGKINNLPYFDESFINKMITPTQNSNGVYGMGLWTNYDSKIHHYYLRGLYGQYVIVVPQENMIVVRMGNKDSKEVDSKNRPSEVEFYINEAMKVL